MIEIISIADNDLANLRSGTLTFDCNVLPELEPLSSLRRCLGHEEAVQMRYGKTPAGRTLVREAMSRIQESNARFVAFHSEHGLFRSPAIAALVGNEMCELGNRVFMTHLKLPVASEELVPVRRTWGYDDVQ